jgi:uncharacterized LabA/DUF88 family protein
MDTKGKVSKKISYQRLIDLLKEDTELIRPYYFDAIKDPPEPFKLNFLDRLRDMGINVETKLLKSGTRFCPVCKTSRIIEFQKGVDVSLATHLMHLAFEDAYDIGIILSGDADYCTAVEYIKRKGKRIWVVCFRDSLCELRGTEVPRVSFNTLVGLFAG